MTSPKISVIVPCYNTSKYVGECLKALVNQTMQEMEIICIDDASTDNTLEILKWYEKYYPKLIKVIPLKENCGVSIARNIGMKIAQGEYIGFVDSDDLISPYMYKHLYTGAMNYQVPISIILPFRINSNDKLGKNVRFKDVNEQKYNNYLNNNDGIMNETMAVWDKLFSHDLISDMEFVPKRIYEDIGFTAYALTKSTSSVVTLSYDYAYRRNPVSIMSNSNHINASMLDCLDVCISTLDKARKNNFSFEQLQMLENALMEQLFVFFLKIVNSDEITDEECEELIPKFISLYTYYFPKFTTLFSEVECEDLKEYLQSFSYSNIIDYQTAYKEKQTLIRKLQFIQENNSQFK